MGTFPRDIHHVLGWSFSEKNLQKLAPDRSPIAGIRSSQIISVDQNWHTRPQWRRNLGQGSDTTENNTLNNRPLFLTYWYCLCKILQKQANVMLKPPADDHQQSPTKRCSQNQCLDGGIANDDLLKPQPAAGSLPKLTKNDAYAIRPPKALKNHRWYPVTWSEHWKNGIYIWKVLEVDATRDQAHGFMLFHFWISPPDLRATWISK